MKEFEDTWVKSIPGRICIACLKNKRKPGADPERKKGDVWGDEVKERASSQIM